MNFEEITPDTRVVCHSRGDVKGTVLSKSDKGFGDGKPVVLIEFDGGARAWNWAEQLSPLDEPAPAPRLRSSGYRSVSSFYLGGDEYRVRNAADGVRGMWQVWRVTSGAAPTNDDCIVSGADTRKAAFAEAVEIIKARRVDSATA